MELIFRDKKFWPLFWTQFLGALNDNFFKNALVMLITYRSIQIGPLDAALLVPLAGGIFIFPFFIFSATSGQMADKFQKATLIRWIKFAEILIMSLATLGLYLDNYLVLLFILFLMGTQSAFFGPLKYGIIPSLVSAEKLVLGNAFVSAGTFIAILIGTIMGGLFVELDQYVLALGLGLTSMALIGYLFSLKIEDVPIIGKETKVDYTFIRPTWEILKLTRKKGEIFATVLGISWYWFLGAGVLSLLPVFVKEGLGGGSQVATFFLATFTVGMGIGSFITDKISKRGVEIGLVPICALGMSFFLALICWVGLQKAAPTGELYTLKEFFVTPYSRGAFLSLLGMAIFGGGYIVTKMAYLQTVADPSELSQTIAGNNIWNALFMVVAAVLIMVLTKTVGISYSFLALGFMNLVVSFLFYAYHSERTLMIWMRFLARLFYDVEVKGGQTFPKEGPVIIVSNHVSFVDWLILMAVIPRPIHFVIDWSYYYLPTGPFWFRQAGLVPIATRKESEEVLKKAFEMIYEDLERGSVLGLFPEGWITRNGQMRRFQPGVAKILKQKHVPVVKVALDGLWGSLFSFHGGKVIFKMPSLKRRKVTVTISDPIAPENYDPKVAEQWIAKNVSHYEAPVVE